MKKRKLRLSSIICKFKIHLEKEKIYNMNFKWNLVNFEALQWL